MLTDQDAREVVRDILPRCDIGNAMHPECGIRESHDKVDENANYSVWAIGSWESVEVWVVNAVFSQIVLERLAQNVLADGGHLGASVPQACGVPDRVLIHLGRDVA